MQNKNAYVSQKEVPFPAETVLVSKTDTRGIITYANDAFVEYLRLCAGRTAREKP